MKDKYYKGFVDYLVHLISMCGVKGLFGEEIQEPPYKKGKRTDIYGVGSQCRYLKEQPHKKRRL